MAKTQENKGAQELNEALNKSEAFIKKYKKALIAAIVAIIVIVAGIIFYNNYQAGRSVEASTAISTAQELIAQQQYEKALKELEDGKQKYADGVKAYEFPAQGMTQHWGHFDRPLAPITTNDLHLTWDVPFTRGEIIAVGRDLDGKEIARQVLRPAGKPASLALTCDRTSLPADGRAVAQLELALLDDAGNTVPDADLPVTLEIEGGELLGMDNGRSDDRTPWRSPVRATWRGLAYAVIRAPRSPGTLRVTASAPDLSLATLELACTLPSMSMPLA